LCPYLANREAVFCFHKKIRHSFCFGIIQETAKVNVKSVNMFVVGSCPYSERFLYVVTLVFPFSSKTNISKFQFDLDTVDEEPPHGYTTTKFDLFKLFFCLLESIDFQTTTASKMCGWEITGKDG